MLKRSSANIKKLRIRSKLKRVNRTLKKRIYLDVSNKHLTAQLLDDKVGKTILTVTTQKKGEGSKNRSNKASAVQLAESFKAKMDELKVKEKDSFVFDRGGKKYHGKVAQFAETLREKGLIF